MAGSSFSPSLADHPRIREEHANALVAASRALGSSPHTRGAQPPGRRQTVHPGIIPAYAGSTSTRTRPPRGPAHHPRIRGEHLRRAAGRRRAGGSSPHTRGARPDGAALLLGGGIIPAYAGSTPSTSGQVGGDADHPRIRGEHSPLDDGKLSTRGSSPHTRGAPHARRRHAPTRRIIPAYAGSTADEPHWVGTLADHPRIRGEHCFLFFL